MKNIFSQVGFKISDMQIIWLNSIGSFGGIVSFLNEINAVLEMLLITANLSIAIIGVLRLTKNKKKDNAEG